MNRQEIYQRLGNKGEVILTDHSSDRVKGNLPDEKIRSIIEAVPHSEDPTFYDKDYQSFLTLAHGHGIAYYVKDGGEVIVTTCYPVFNRNSFYKQDRFVRVA